MFDIFFKLCYHKFMRVDSGIYKGRKLIENKYDHIRPTTDKVRQALFTKLQLFIQDKKVLDLFCGTGAIGIEALSWGASEVVFVDKDIRSVKMTRENLNNLNIKAKVLHSPCESFLNFCNQKFDLIILDPPYKSGLYEKVLNKIFEKEILSEDGIIVCEHAKLDTFDYSPFFVFDQKNYGNITLTYLKYHE